jgi:hypothetical protein
LLLSDASIRSLLHSRLGTRWSDVDVMKSLKAEIGRCREQRSFCVTGGDTRSSPHLSVVALGCLNEGDERGDRQGRYSS